ncbi:MAG: inositol monophosphatase family protein [Acidimicrobiales bacterium]
MNDAALLTVLHESAQAVRGALDKLDNWGPAGTRAGQYLCDLAADEAAVKVLVKAGLGVLSEESGGTHLDREVVVVLDPVDGSTNASLGIAWFATSLCALDAGGPRAAVVVNQASGIRYEASAGGGARRDGAPIAPSGATTLSDAIIGLSGYPPAHLGWRQFRALGAAALDLCLVADGTLDGFADCSPDSLGPWDYMGGLLICHEAGARMGEARGRDLVVRNHGDRRTPLAGASLALLDELGVAWATAFGNSATG